MKDKSKYFYEFVKLRVGNVIFMYLAILLTTCLNLAALYPSLDVVVFRAAFVKASPDFLFIALLRFMAQFIFDTYESENSSICLI